MSSTSDSESNNNNESWADPSNAYIVSGSIAGPLLAFVLYTFCRFKRIRSHPAPLMFARTLADTGFIFTTLLLSAVVTDNENNAKICSNWGPLIAFFFMTSNMYFIGMCYDLYITCNYPLRSTSYTARKIHLYSWLLSALIIIIFKIFDPKAYEASDTADLCFLELSDNNSSNNNNPQEWVTFLLPYIIGIISGISSLLFVGIRLRNGLGDVFEHANIMVKDHIIFVSLYTILGIAWFILLLAGKLDSNGVSFAVSFIIVGTASIDCTTWILQKFRTKTMRNNPLHRTTYLGNFLRKQTELMGVDDDIINLAELQQTSSDFQDKQTMSSALRLELIRNMCSGVTQSLDHFKHNREYNDNDVVDVTALHFPPVSSIKMTKNSNLEKECLKNQSIHRFLMASHSGSGGTDQIDFIDYAPHVFRYLRSQCFATSETEYAESVKIAIENNSSMEQLSAKFSEGKSGAFFFMTANAQFMIKTVRKSEAITFLKILPGYFEHMRKFPNSFITQFYGLYGIKLYGTRLYFTIMKNIFVADLEPHEKYDIKGSWINRHTKHHIELGKLMKDEDLKKSILIKNDKSKKAWEQMSHDTRFLNTLNIMDYSLLLGIYYIGINNTNLNNFSFNANSTIGGSYKPPSSDDNDNDKQQQPNIELQITKNNNNNNNEEENEELKQEELKEGDDITGVNNDNNNKNEKNNNQDHGKSKSDFLDLNTLKAMEKDFSKLGDKFSPRNKGGKDGNKLRRRAFTAGTGLAELSSHPMAYQSRMIEGPGFYIMGIIDILQEYNFEKKIERFFKVFVKCVDAYGISCIEPSMYRKRFLAKMLQIGIGRGDD